MARLVWTLESERWIKDIFDYIARDNPDAAKGVVAEIYDSAQSLLQFPESGYKYEGGPRMSVFCYMVTIESRTEK